MLCATPSASQVFDVCHGAIVRGVYGAQSGMRFMRVVRSMHHGVVAHVFASSAAANPARVRWVAG